MDRKALSPRERKASGFREGPPGVPRRRGGSKWHVAFPDTRKLILSIGAKTSCPKREGGDQGSPRVTPQR